MNAEDKTRNITELDDAELTHLAHVATDSVLMGDALFGDLESEEDMAEALEVAKGFAAEMKARGIWPEGVDNDSGR